MEKLESKTIVVKVKDLVPYARNPRRNDGAVETLKKSLMEFGYVSRIVVAEDMTIVAGHTRLKAMMELGWQDKEIEVTQYLASPDTIKAYRIADNSTGDIADWDYDLLTEELDDIELDMSDFGFTFTDDGEIDFSDLESRMAEKSEAQLAFEDKFKVKHTTDDCFTPPAVYDAVKDWVLNHYKLSKDREIVRPFYPGGDYQSYDYPKGCLVLDNPPFSITSEIVSFYTSKGIDFFLFGQGTTLMQTIDRANMVVVGLSIVYENGAEISTGFITSLGTSKVTISASLHDAIERAQPSETMEVSAYDWPHNVISGALLGKLPKYGTEMEIRKAYATKKVGTDGVGIYGGGGGW